MRTFSKLWRLRVWPVAACAAVALGGPAQAGASASGFTVANPPASLADAGITGIDASSHSNVWAVGSQGSGFGLHPVAERFNGTSWNPVTLPSLPGPGFLADVDVVSAQNIWMVGGFTTSDGVRHGLLLRYNGATWTRGVTPSKLSFLNQIEVHSNSDADVIGADAANLDCADPTDVSRWNGVHWQALRSRTSDCIDGIHYGQMTLVPGDGLLMPGQVRSHDSGDGPFFDCYGAGCPAGQPPWPATADQWQGDEGGSAGLSPTDEWIAGNSHSFTKGTALVIDHWTGAGWTHAVSAFYPTNHDLHAMAEISASEVWAVGDRVNDARVTRSLIVRYTASGGLVDLGGPNPGDSTTLTGLVHVPGTGSEMWAIGYSNSAPDYVAHQVLLHHS